MCHLFLKEDTNTRNLGILRSSIFLIWFIIILFSPLTSYSFLPASIFEPWGIFRLLFPHQESIITKVVLSYNFLLLLKILSLIGCFLCIIGLRPFQIIAIPTVLLLTLSEGIVKGFNGYINHAELVPLYAAMVISLYPSADDFSILGRKQNSNSFIFPIFLITTILLLSYSFVGINRFIREGFEIYQHNALRNELLVNSLQYTKYGFDYGLNIAKNKWLLLFFNMGFLIVTIFEILSPLSLINRYFSYIWVAVIIPFHILSLFTMNIFFWGNLILIIILFLVIPHSDALLISKQE